eukprot:gene19570-23975_t
MTLTDNLHGGLSNVADMLQVDRIGPMHQAGSDSLLTAQVFFGMVQKMFAGVCDDSKFKGELYGVGTNYSKYKSKYNSSSAAPAPNPSHPALQFSASVHYPAGGAHAMMQGAGGVPQSPAPQSFGYEEGY